LLVPAPGLSTNELDELVSRTIRAIDDVLPA
jgi:hypothetical protein